MAPTSTNKDNIIMNVQNMTSSQGNAVPNQFIITDDNKTVFQSYNSVIAINENGKITLDESKWDCSVTTGRYRNEFLGEGIAVTRTKIKNGTYKLANLN